MKEEKIYTLPTFPTHALQNRAVCNTPPLEMYILKASYVCVLRSSNFTTRGLEKIDS